MIVQNKGPSSAEAHGLCAYTVRWETPEACPRNATISGTNGSCLLTDPVTGVVYDMRALARTNSYYEVNGTGRSFKVLNLMSILCKILQHTLDAEL